MLFHFFMHLKKNTNQEAQLWLLVVLCYILLHRLFHKPNFLFVFYLYGGAIQIETLKWVMNWFSKERKDTSCHVGSQKDQKLWRKFTFDISKFKSKTNFNKKLNYLGIFWYKQICGSQTLKIVWKYYCRF